jgi:C_GCAxxG_C_C family probable redox protein
MSDRIQKAADIFGGGFNCAQAVLSSFSEDFGLSATDALRVAGPFGAGMGRMGKVCGAVTGAFMTIGLRYAKTKVGEDDKKAEGYSLVQEFTLQFEALHGSIDCKELLGVDLSTPEGIREAEARGLFQTSCAAFVKDAVLILEDILPT